MQKLQVRQDDEARADYRLTTGSTEKSACPLGRNNLRAASENLLAEPYGILGLTRMIGVDGGQEHLRMLNGQSRRAFQLS